MKTTMLLAGAIALAFAGGAAAKDRPSHGVHAHKAHKAKTARAARRPAQPAPQKDPYAKYWDDPTRQGPFSYFGRDTY